MSEPVTGLTCPRCGGIVPIPEGQVIVACPYCEQRSVVSAQRPPAPPPQPEAQLPKPAPIQLDKNNPPSPEQMAVFTRSANPLEMAISELVGQSQASSNTNSIIDLALTPAESTGVRRYQVQMNIDRDAAIAVFQKFVSGKVQVARDCGRTAQVSEVFLVHLPFWTVWGRGLAYAFGQQQVGSGDNKRYEPREKRTARELTWNGPACEVGEFGVRQVKLDGRVLQPFNADELHRSGMVFEPVGSPQVALESAENDFRETLKNDTNMSRVEQLFVRLARPRLGLVYYPLWVVRYRYRGRAFQVVVDAYAGEVLFGKAPGSVAYRAAVLVGGMALGSLLIVDGPALLVQMSDSSDKGDGILWGILFMLMLGAGMLWRSYSIFRKGEQYEYHRYGKAAKGKNSGLLNFNGASEDMIKEISGIISMAEKNR
jgi:uncharacterized Zn finger protein (UPF0148 family)